MNEIEFVESVKVLEIKPGDLLVIKVKPKISQTAYEKITKHLTDIFPGVKAVVLDEETDVGIIRGSR